MFVSYRSGSPPAVGRFARRTSMWPFRHIQVSVVDSPGLVSPVMSSRAEPHFGHGVPPGDSSSRLVT